MGNELLAIERAAVRGWPALDAEGIDGWIARCSRGGSVRANTVAALDYNGSDLAASIAAVEAFYHARSAVPAFTISEASSPAGLDDELSRRGWTRRGDHVTMALDLTEVASTSPRRQVVVAEHPDDEWLAVYLAGVSDSRRAVAPRLVAGVPAPRRFFSCREGSRTIASGLSVRDGDLASVQCMATLKDARRSGAASAVLAAIADWATVLRVQRLYLQTDADNAAAIGLYQRFGFSIVGRYHTRHLDR